MTIAMAALAAAAAPPDARAQQRRDTQGELHRLEEERERTRRSRDAVRSARDRDVLGGRRVTYEEVLRRPDDVSLNLDFAKTQIREGDLTGASSTLERVLLVAPANLESRLLNAVVLYRLDSRVEAEREIGRLLSARLPPDIRARLQSYLVDIRARDRLTSLSVLVTGGFAYDTNRNSAPSSQRVDTGAGRVRLFGTDLATADISGQGQLHVGVRRRIGEQLRHSLVGSLTALHSDQARFDQLTVSAVNGRVGLVLDLAPFTIEPGVSASYVLLSHQQYMRSLAAGLSVSFAVTDALKIGLFGSAATQNFDGLSEEPLEHLRSGGEYRGGVDIRYKLRSDMRAIVRALFVRNAAGADFYSYSGTQLQVEHRWLLARGMFLLSRFAWDWELYDEGDPDDGGMRRQQHRLIAGLTFGVPLAGLAPSAPGALGRAIARRTTFTAGVEYTRALSNITNYTYSNWRFLVGLTISAQQ